MLKSEPLTNKNAILLKSDMIAKKNNHFVEIGADHKKTKKSNGGGAISWKSEPITEKKGHFVETGPDRTKKKRSFCRNWSRALKKGHFVEIGPGR